MSLTTFNDALCFVAQRHAAQSCPGSLQKDSYSCHCLRVADYVRTLGGNDTLVVVALLYATLKESVATLEELTVQFGARVAQQVWQLTEQKAGDSRQYWAQQINRLSTDLLLIKLVSVLDILNAMVESNTTQLLLKRRQQRSPMTLALMMYTEQVHHIFFVALSIEQLARMDARHTGLLKELERRLKPYIHTEEEKQAEAMKETAQYLLKLEQAAALY
jgi:(p)ppGpp synthase/HD superfamily hydrolase